MGDEFLGDFRGVEFVFRFARGVYVDIVLLTVIDFRCVSVFYFRWEGKIDINKYEIFLFLF